jgi:hypothetical protein
MKRVLVSALIAATLTMLGGTAAAAPSPTPAGWIGACNMSASWPGLGVQNPNGVGVQPGGGMERAMTVDNPNGNAGMFHATDVSGDQDC